MPIHRLVSVETSPVPGLAFWSPALDLDKLSITSSPPRARLGLQTHAADGNWWSKFDSTQISTIPTCCHYVFDLHQRTHIDLGKITLFGRKAQVPVTTDKQRTRQKNNLFWPHVSSQFLSFFLAVSGMLDKWEGVAYTCTYDCVKVGTEHSARQAWKLHLPHKHNKRMVCIY